jgi:DNA polymerase-3 subunit epsilon
MKSFVALDFETANHNRSSVCSIGIVIVKDSIIVDKFYELIKPRPNFYCNWATEIHGIKYWDTYNSLEFPDVWMKISERISNLPIIAHNMSFDKSCLLAVHELYGMPQPQNSFHCTLANSKKKHPGLPNYQLDTVSKHLGFELHNHHNALADAEACAWIALKTFD